MTATGRVSHGVAFVAALVGLAISIYLTVEHYAKSASLACPETGAINCLKVTTSRWAILAGIPVAVLGLAFFTAMTVLLLLPSWRVVAALRLAGAVVGVLMVLYLVYIELFKVDAICLWCTGVHACTLVLFGAVLWHTLNPADPAIR